MLLYVKTIMKLLYALYIIRMRGMFNISPDSFNHLGTIQFL